METDFSGNYKVLRKVQNGSSSKIFLVEHKTTKKTFICKRVRDNEFISNEISLPNLINSERVVKIIKVYKTSFQAFGYYYYIIMKHYPDFIDVFDYTNNRLLTEELIKPIVKEMALAIKDCHDNNIAHLDIKSENFVIIDKDPIKLLLIDFGASHKINESLHRLFGTVLYSAPEIKNLNFNLSSDVWSLGAYIYYILTNKETLKVNKIYVNQFISVEKFSSSLKKLLYGMLSDDMYKRINIDDVLNSEWLKDS